MFGEKICQGKERKRGALLTMGKEEGGERGSRVFLLWDRGRGGHGGKRGGGKEELYPLLEKGLFTAQTRQDQKGGT